MATKISATTTRVQWISIGAAIVLLLVLYFGFSTKSPEHKQIELVRSQNIESTSIQNLLNEAGKELSPEASNLLHAMEAEMQAAGESDSARLEHYKAMSSFWYEQGKYPIAGHFAEKVAQVLQTAEAWSIAGTTHAATLQRDENEERRNFSLKRAVNAFESAISLQPDNPQHQLNLALCYAEMPPADNPMKGIQMLLKLQEEQPEYIGAKIALVRLAIKTAQYERALERLNQASDIDPDDPRLPCLYFQVHQALGNAEEAAKYEIDCLK